MTDKRVNIGRMKNSNIVMGDVTGNVHSGNTPEFKKHDLEKFLALLTESLDALDFSKDQRDEVVAEVNTLEAQSSSPKPKFRIVKESLLSIRSILEGITGSMLATKLLQILAGTLGSIP